ncbi:MAG: hypothetical protein LBS91_03910, partial [Clostridiales Family XIII bacterium]|nr:hypothetical protein [Clostridiales Family XIII bacterium]
ALSPVEIETDADVISLILAIDDRVGITFDGKKDSKGKIDTKTLTIRIDDLFVNDALARYGNAKNHLAKLKGTAVTKKDKKEHAAQIAGFEEALSLKKLNLIDTNKVIGKNKTGVTIKIAQSRTGQSK